MNEKKIGIVNRCAPHGSAFARESLDLTLALSAFNESLSLFFIDDGVYQLQGGQLENDILQKNAQPLFKMLALYDVENVFVCEHSLTCRGISLNDLMIDVSVVNRQQLTSILARQDQLLSF